MYRSGENAKDKIPRNGMKRRGRDPQKNNSDRSKQVELARDSREHRHNLHLNEEYVTAIGKSMWNLETMVSKT